MNHKDTIILFFGLALLKNSYLYDDEFGILYRMNLIDLILCLVLLVAVWNGWRRGFILQICSLVALVAAIWLAARFGGEAAALLRIESEYAEPAGFVVVLVVALIVISLLARLVRKVFHFAGFGMLDIVLGIIIAAVKYLLVVSVIFAAIDRLNADYSLIPRTTIESSHGYRPVRNISRQILPFVTWAAEQVEEVTQEVTKKE